MTELQYGDTVVFDGKEYTVRVHYDAFDGGKADKVKITRHGFPKFVPRSKVTKLT